MKENRIFEKVKDLMKGYLLEDIKKDFDELTKLNEERKNISICVKVNGVFRYNEKYLAHDKKIKDKIKEVGAKYKTAIDTYNNDKEIRQVFSDKGILKENIVAYLGFFRSMYVLKMLVRANTINVKKDAV